MGRIQNLRLRLNQYKDSKYIETNNILYMRQQEQQVKSSIKKHRRIRSQELVHSSGHGLDKLISLPSRANERYEKENLVVEIINPNGYESVKIVLRKGMEMKMVKEEFCKKLEIFIDEVYFYSLDQDYNFDYRLQEEIGAFQAEKKLSYTFVDGERDSKGGIIESESISEYFIYDCLSVGGFSKVFLVRSKKSGIFYAAKFVNKNYDKSQKFRDLIYNQKYVNELLDYPMLVKMHKFIETREFYVFILDYCPSGELFCLMKEHRDMTEQQAKFYFIQTVLAIEYMHSKSIIYRDIKPENILLDKNGHVKIADFGLAKIMREKSTSYCGSLEYMAPEIVLGTEHSFGVDHYCLGSLLFEMMVGCPPFYNPNFSSSQTKYHIVNSEVKFPSDSNFSPEMINLVRGLLDKNPKSRLGSLGGIKEILAHPWVGKFDRKKYQNHLIEPPFKIRLDRSNFQTTYLPKEEIQIVRKKIEKEMQDKNRENRSFKKVGPKFIVERARLRSSETQFKCGGTSTSTPKRKEETSTPKEGRMSKKLSLCSQKNLLKVHHKSLHTEQSHKTGKIRSLTKNQKHGSINEAFQMQRRAKNRQNIINAYATSECKSLKRSHNTTLHRKSGNGDKENAFKMKFETKSKQSRKVFMGNLRTSIAQQKESQKVIGKKGTQIETKISRALMNAIQR